MSVVDWVHNHTLRMHAVHPPEIRQGHVGRPHRHVRSRESRILAGLLAFNGIGAVFGGVGLLLDVLGMPASLLRGTPFSNYTIPAVILLVIVGGSSMLASMFVWNGTRLGGLAAIAAGAILLGWIVTEFIMIPEAWMAQLLYFVLALAILWLGWRLYWDGDRRA